ncbi:MAG: 2-C-methyl-D-erythritol 4-phosphate cytidylyltransferase [SAR324 cluster bacterium]|nr:2-C-methyl-D-erythritol 4-phosphate cytidylyltransferase [SAR324 cluster bacterium]MCH8888404.1 2-C-methyl-D-erythritol 4-phosphate cytidylyltransferase [SAR324 cluster bacterium]
MTSGATRQGGTAVLIPAAGSGRRMAGEGAGNSTNKVLLPLKGVAMLRHTVDCFQGHRRVDMIAIAARAEDFPALDALFGAETQRGKLLPWITGGAERQDSVRHGLQALRERPAGPPRWVLVHDGARPLCPPGLIDRVLDALAAGALGVIPVVAVTDSLRRMGGDRSATIPRDGLVRVQTPQGFAWEALWRAHRHAGKTALAGTDDAQLLEGMGVQVTSVEGDPGNIKVTSPEDLRMAERLMGD